MGRGGSQAPTRGRGASRGAGLGERAMISTRAEELLQQEMQGLSLDEPGTATVRPCGPEQRDHRARRMVRELEELRKHFATGRGDFDPIYHTKEQVTLLWDTEDDLHVLDIQVWGYGSSENNKVREEELEAQFGLLTFGRTQASGPVLEVERVGSGFHVSPVVREDVRLAFMKGFSREQRALEACQSLLRGEGGGKALEVLLRGVPNRRALLPGGGVAVAAVADDVNAPLNDAQRRTLAPEETRVVQLVHGPPGTGKTSVIDRLIRSPASQGCCLHGAKRRHVVAVLSEKNLAVDAVAASLLRRGGGTPEHQVWKETIAHGASKSLGENAKCFLLESKVLSDPAVTAAQRLKDATDEVKQGKSTALRQAVQQYFGDIAAACTGERVVTLDKLDAAGQKARITLAQATKKLSGEYEKLAAVASEVPTPAWWRPNRPRVVAAKAAIAAASEDLRVARHDRDRAVHALAKAKEVALKRLTKKARVVLSTLGSAHGVLEAIGADSADSEEDVEDDEVSLTVICDEASTVHTALFVGAIKGIRASVTNIIVIGDDRQLPPYWPVQDGHPRSLFDDAQDATDAVFLSQQYRVPRYVMRILNEHFYTDEPLVYAKRTEENDCAHPLWIHVPSAACVDASASCTETSVPEARAAAAKAAQESAAGRSVMLITPYRKQRGLLEEELEEKPGRVAVTAANCTVCTVDGAQGQEADVVIISLVKAKPSRFLNDRRLCVMLSRARSKLILVGDRCSHTTCRCAPLQELARLCGPGGASSPASTGRAAEGQVAQSGPVRNAAVASGAPATSRAAAPAGGDSKGKASKKKKVVSEAAAGAATAAGGSRVTGARKSAAAAAAAAGSGGTAASNGAAARQRALPASRGHKNAYPAR